MDIKKTGIFSIVGRPNAGKSTLVNRLCGTKVAIVSPKPQTTRTRITGIANTDEHQFVFLDTPGFHSPKTHLGEYMVRIVNSSVSAVDTAVLMIEPVANIGPAEQALIDKIKEHNIPAILVINKIDTVKKEELLAVIAEYSACHEFNAVIPVSALKGDGMTQLVTELKNHCIESPPLFPEGMLSDQPEKQVIAEIIREKMLYLLDKEVPHGIAIEIERFSERENGIIDIDATIYCERKSHKGIIIGKNGAMLKNIGARARADIENMLESKVFMQLWVKVREGWRNNPAQLRNFGYDKKAID